MPSWHRQYRGESIGRVLHFLYHYCGFDVAEQATVGKDTVIYHGEVIAKYEFLSDTDIPHFIFQEPKYRGREMKEQWEYNQRNKWHLAIKDADKVKPEPCTECRSLKLKVSMLEDMYKRRIGKE